MTHLAKHVTTLVLTLALLGAALAQNGAADGGDAASNGAADANAGQEGAASIAAAITDDPRLSTLAALFEDTGYLAQLEDSARLTFFAPSDRAFERLGEETTAELFRNRGALDVIMRHHMVFGASPLNALRNLDALTTLEGTRLQVEDRDGRVAVEGVPVGDGMAAGDGVIYVIDRLLLPPAAAMVKDLLGGPAD